MDAGFAKIRRGLREHIQSGRMYPLDLSTFTLLIMDADPRTGLVYSSAARLAHLYRQPNQWFRESLERLELALYIKRFAKRYSPRPYPILINRFLLSLGPNSGMYVDAINTIDYREIKLLHPEVVPKSSRSRPEVSTSPNIGRETLDLRLEIKPKALGQQTPLTANADGFEEFWNHYPRKIHKFQAMEAWARMAINGHAAEVVLAVEKWKLCEQWQEERYIPHPATFLNQRQWQDEPPKSLQEKNRETIERVFKKFEKHTE